MCKEEKKDLLCIYCRKRGNIFFSWFVIKTRFNVCRRCWKKHNSEKSTAATLVIWKECVICREEYHTFVTYKFKPIKNLICYDCYITMMRHFEEREKRVKKEFDDEEGINLARLELLRSYTGERNLRVIK